MSSPTQPSSNFSQTALAKTVRQQIASHPLTAYPLAAGLGSLVCFSLFPLNPLLWTGAAGISLGLLTWIINQFGRRQTFAARNLRQMQERLQKEREAKLQSISHSLEELDCPAGSAQLKKQKENYDMFMQVLNQKLNPMEITYGRYLGIVEQVYLATLDNLQKVVLALTSVKSIDRQYIEQQIKALDENGIDNSATDYENLHNRLQLLDEATLKVDQLLNTNEQAITLLVTTATKLAAIETTPGHSSMAMEDAMSELSHLTKNIAVYDRSNT